MIQEYHETEEEGLKFLSYNVEVYTHTDKDKELMVIAVDSISVLVGADAIMKTEEAPEEGPLSISDACAASMLRIFDSIQGQFQITRVTHD